MTNLEQRVWRLEQLVQLMQQQIAGLLADVAQLKQQQWAGGGGWGNGGGGGGGYFGCITSADLPAGPGTTLASQTVWTLDHTGTRTNLSGTYTLVNDTGHDIPSSSQVVLAPNTDGSYTVANVVC